MDIHMSHQKLFIDQLHKMYKNLDKPVKVGHSFQVVLSKVAIDVFSATVGTEIIATWELFSN